MKSFSHHGGSVNSDFRIELRVCGSPFYFLKQAPTRSEGGESAGMGGIKVDVTAPWQREGKQCGLRC